jgi:hypothetical protein
VPRSTCHPETRQPSRTPFPTERQPRLPDRPRPGRGRVKPAPHARLEKTPPTAQPNPARSILRCSPEGSISNSQRLARPLSENSTPESPVAWRPPRSARTPAAEDRPKSPIPSHETRQINRQYRSEGSTWCRCASGIPVNKRAVKEKRRMSPENTQETYAIPVKFS